MRLMTTFAAAAFALVSPLQAQTLPAPEPTPQAQLVYDAPFYDADAHDPAISTPERLLGFLGGQRAATHAELLHCFETWSAESPRANLVRYATSYEGRDLFYLVITSPRNLADIEQIRAGLDRLADPRAGGDLEALAGRLPAVAWMAYSIHGDELSGADGALLAAYHLLASTEPSVTSMLEDIVVIIDPLMNPDGRDRYIQQIRQHDGRVPGASVESLVRNGYWPWGRTNHYLFDLNRDWIFGVHPETRGRIDAVKRWHPLMFVDGHEMGGLDTYLFSPSRQPVNPNLPPRRLHWWDVFAEDQARAFDAFGWRYYTGEWNEEWYPGYSSSWAGFRGAVGILYEQAGVSHQGMERPEGTTLTYRESVHHQYISTIANLETFHRHHRQLMREFLQERQAAVSAAGDAPRTFAILPGRNQTRARELTDLLRLQGVEVHVAGESFEAPGVDQLGVAHDAITVPEGALLVSERQPERALVRALLEFDPHMTPAFLEEERRSLLRRGESRLYDVTAWNLTMMYGLDAFELEAELPPHARPWSPPSTRVGINGDGADVAFVIDGADDRGVIAAAHLMERGRQVRVADRAFTLDGREFARGSFLVTRSDNPTGGPRDFRADIETVCARLGIGAEGVATGLGAGDLPDLGGEHFVLLNRPRVALLGRGGFDPYDYGSTWFTLDHRMSMRATYLNDDEIGVNGDLRAYNVVILPASWGELEASRIDELRDWVKAGGTLIAVGSSAAALATEDGIGSVRMLEDVLDDLDAYEQAVLREWQGRHATVDPDEVWAHGAPSAIVYPWQDGEERPAVEELETRDAWQRIFMPQGAFVAGRVDDEHWLTFGCDGVLPVIAGDGPVLMTTTDAEAPVRIGVWSEAMDVSESPARVGWSRVPPGRELRVRMSGLLWPEATQRLANSAWVTRERVGAGQVILFAGSPTFRGAALGTTRVLMNAVVCGPGCGTNQPILPR